MSRQFDEAFYATHQAKHGRPPISTKTEPAPYVVKAKPVKAANKSKYGNVKTADGDSKKESRRLQELKLLQAAGAISNLAWQVRYMLIPSQLKADFTYERPMTYTCDAQYIEQSKLVVEDTKSEVTRKLPRYIAARKLMLQLYNIEIKEV